MILNDQGMDNYEHLDFHLLHQILIKVFYGNYHQKLLFYYIFFLNFYKNDRRNSKYQQYNKQHLVN